MKTISLYMRTGYFTSFAAFLGLALCCFTCVESQGSVYGATASYTGTRTVTDPGLSTGDPDWQDAVITWLISPDGSLWDYQYTFTGFNSPGISHFVLDITDDAVDNNEPTDDLAITNARLNGNLIPSASIEFKNSESGITGAVKFDVGEEFAGTEDTPAPLIYTFTSNRDPVWGDLFIKGGQTSLTNTGINDHNSDNILDFIARPNGGDPVLEEVVPEPATFVVWTLLGCCAATMISKRQRIAN